MRIYVGSLPFSTTDDQLRDLFASFGTVDSSRIVRDWDTGRSRGFGFIEMTGQPEGTRAIESLNGSAFGGRNLVVNEARPRQPRAGAGRD